MKEVTDYYPELEVLEIGYDFDRVHTLISIPPKMGVGKVVGIKTNTIAED